MVLTLKARTLCKDSFTDGDGPVTFWSVSSSSYLLAVIKHSEEEHGHQEQRRLFGPQEVSVGTKIKFVHLMLFMQGKKSLTEKLCCPCVILNFLSCLFTLFSGREAAASAERKVSIYDETLIKAELWRLYSMNRSCFIWQTGRLK